MSQHVESHSDFIPRIRDDNPTIGDDVVNRVSKMEYCNMLYQEF